jgi:hypothetical protein
MEYHKRLNIGENTVRLRTRILKCGIKCTPWKIWKHELPMLPISSQTLFRRNGIEISILNQELIDEGFLLAEEDLFEVLINVENLKRTSLWEIDSDFPEDWTEEDYRYFYEE